MGGGLAPKALCCLEFPLPSNLAHYFWVQSHSTFKMQAQYQHITHMTSSLVPVRLLALL